ncbi:hypothetical protein FBY50_0938 [Zymomonas mobilis]|uniref:retropepsin-like aspartic protease n=1 Tax=Zymomonas mobilis TaxID=542 RepID=UPI000B38930D|nr:retropepsin-like aspartic protease [Zymomonas mobilis]ART93426.1 hypothetical protein B9T50_04445 [Zymomonas mobilis subsp. mobilis]TWD60125.1 hypothetical protein FBY50_0938 [Zymomonas mobilis]
MKKRFILLVLTILANSLNFSRLSAKEYLPSPRLVDLLKQQSPQALQEGLKLSPGGDESADALFEGNTLRLQRMTGDSRIENFAKKFASIEALRIKGDFEEANKQLSICHKTFFREAGEPPISPINLSAMVCDQLLAGNYFLEGNLAAWGKEIDNIKSTYYPAVRKFAGLEQFSLFDIKMGNLSVAPNSIPPFTVTGINRQQTLPLEYREPTAKDCCRTLNSPSLTASLNKKDLPFFLETDTAIGKLPKELSRSPHIHIVGHIEIAGNGRGEAFNGDLGVVDELKIGDAVLKNVPFLFTNTKEASLGLMVFQKLGKIKIDRQHFTFGKEIDCHCQQDIRLGSSFSGSYNMLRYPITWKGKTELAAIDLSQTDADFSLMAFQKDFTPEEEKQSFEINREIEGKKIIAHLYLEEGSLSVDNIDYGKRKKVVEKNIWRYPSKVMTVTILDKASLYLDFINHKACLMPNNSDTQPMPQ